MNPRLFGLFFGTLLTLSSSTTAWASDAATLATEPGAPRHLLSLLVFLPLAGVAYAVGWHRFGRGNGQHLRRLMLVLTGAELALSAWIHTLFDPSLSRAGASDGYQLVERVVLGGTIGGEYFVGIDGISLTMVLLTTLLAFVGVLASSSTQKRPAVYWASYCLLLTGMLGAFVALDLRLLYGFWQLALIASCVLVGLFGGQGRRRATLELAITGILGSAALLFAIVALYLHSDPVYLSDGSIVQHSFALPELARVDYLQKGALVFGVSFVKVVFVALFIAFAGTLAVLPFHFGVIDALVEAPLPISLLLTGAYLKLGGYGLLRLNLGVLPEASAWAGTTMAALGVATLLYGTLRALSQSDFKRFVVYVSMGQLGYCLLGMASLTPAGIQASVMQMVSHGLIVALLFVLGGVLESRVQTREMARFGGLAQEMPLYAALTGFAFLASLGTPGLSAFIGEAMALMGAFPVHERLTLLAALGIGTAAACHARAFRMLILGSFRQEWRSSHVLEPFGGKFPELRPRELVTIAPLAIFILLLGFWPRPLLALSNGNAIDLANALRPLGPMQISQFETAERAIALLR